MRIKLTVTDANFQDLAPFLWELSDRFWNSTWSEIWSKLRGGTFQTNLENLSSPNDQALWKAISDLAEDLGVHEVRKCAPVYSDIGWSGGGWFSFLSEPLEVVLHFQSKNDLKRFVSEAVDCASARHREAKTPQQKLVKFVKEKARALSTATNLPTTIYFSKEDKKLLMKLPDKKATKAWQTLYRNIREDAAGLQTRVCPFCFIAKYDCEQCGYAKNHNGACPNDGSDFKALRARLSSLELSPETILSSSFYKNLLQAIEREED